MTAHPGQTKLAASSAFRQSMARSFQRIALAGLGFGLIGVDAGHAQSCPANLTGLSSQIETAGLQARLSLPMATIIENAGGVDQALARTRTALADVQARRTAAVAAGRDTQALDDSILIFTHQIEALECIKG